MKLLFFFVLTSVFNHSYAQTREDFIENFMKERKEMMKKMDEMVKSAMNDNDSFDYESKSSVNINQIKENDGTISIYIGPTNKNVDLKIKSTDSLIKVTTRSNFREQKGESSSRSVFSSSSSSSQIISIPDGFKALPAQTTEDDRLLIKLVKHKGKIRSIKNKQDFSRLPIKKSSRDRSL